MQHGGFGLLPFGWWDTLKQLQAPFVLLPTLCEPAVLGSVGNILSKIKISIIVTSHQQISEGFAKLDTSCYTYCNDAETEAEKVLVHACSHRVHQQQSWD